MIFEMYGFHSYQYKSMLRESQSFAHSSSILDHVQTSQKEIPDGWYVKEKWTRGVQRTIFEMYAFSIIINIGLCHGNPIVLSNLTPYWLMSRHPKWKSQIDGKSNKNGQEGYRRRFFKCMLFHSYQYGSLSRESQTIANSSSILGGVQTSQKDITTWVIWQRKMEDGCIENDFWNLCVFRVINIGPCHWNPRLLHTLVPYWVMST